MKVVIQTNTELYKIFDDKEEKRKIDKAFETDTKIKPLLKPEKRIINRKRRY